MKIKVLFFARLRELTGAPEAELDLDPQANVSDALLKLTELYPALGDALSACRVAVNEEFVPVEAALSEDAVLAVIPPVSGG